MKRYFDTVIIGLGIFFVAFGIYLLWERQAPRELLINGSSANSAIVSPVRLTIPGSSIDLAIYPAQIVNKKWETSSEGVSYLTTSPKPGKVGNSIMYGHNWSNLLGGLKTVKPGDSISVTNSDGNIYKYKVYFVSVIASNEIHILKNTTDHRLTLYTCTGFLDSKRLVATAILE